MRMALQKPQSSFAQHRISPNPIRFPELRAETPLAPAAAGGNTKTAAEKGKKLKYWIENKVSLQCGLAKNRDQFLNFKRLVKQNNVYN